MNYFIARYVCLGLCSVNLGLLGKQLDVSVNAESAILINADTGAILYEKKAYDLQFPASITKVATALYALQAKGDHLNDLIAAESEAIASVTEATFRSFTKSGIEPPTY